MGIKGRSGGARSGAGRKTIKTDREIREQLQKLIPQALSLIEADLRLAINNKSNTNSAWKLIDKFVPNRLSSEITGFDSEPLQIKIIGGGFMPPDLDPRIEVVDPLKVPSEFEEIVGSVNR